MKLSTCTRKHDLSDQAVFFHCSMIQLQGTCAYCRHFWWWTGDGMRILTSLGLLHPFTRSSTVLCALSLFCHTSHLPFQQFAPQLFCGMRPRRLAFWSLCKSVSLLFAHELPMIMLQVPAFLGALLAGTDDCMPGTPNKICRFRNLNPAILPL